MSIPLAALEEIIDASGVAPRVEALLPVGVRHRQLRIRTLLAGMMLSQAGQRPAHLTRVRDALTALPGPDQVRLGVLEDWETGPHLLTYRQTERTFGLVTGALAKDHPDWLQRKITGEPEVKTAGSGSVRGTKMFGSAPTRKNGARSIWSGFGKSPRPESMGSTLTFPTG